MKATEEFKRTIKAHLDQMAKEDELFASSYAKPHKSLDECVNYILNEVKKSGCNGFADDEIYGMAVHYYDEDDIKNVKSVNTQVVVNHQVELTPQEKAAIKRKAKAAFEEECLKEMRNRNKRTSEASKKASAKTETNQPQQLSLFDL